MTTAAQCAADRIEELESALAPFAAMTFPAVCPDGAGVYTQRAVASMGQFTVGDVRRAAALLAPAVP